MSDDSRELALECPKYSKVPLVEPVVEARPAWPSFAQPRPARVPAALATLLAMVLLAALAAHFAPHALSGLHRTGATVSAEQLVVEGRTPEVGVMLPVMWKLRAGRAGCVNFRNIKLEEEPTTEASADKCGERCRSHGNCTGFGYQPEPCAASKLNVHNGMIVTGFGKFQGACYLWAGECESEANNCWDDYIMTDARVDPTSEPDRIGVVIPTGGIPVTPADLVIKEDATSFYMRQKNSGCKNWRDILIANNSTTGRIVANNSEACARRCWDVGCTGFGFMPQECNGTSSPPGSCFLWKGACEDDNNPCWYDYVLQ